MESFLRVELEVVFNWSPSLQEAKGSTVLFTKGQGTEMPSSLPLLLAHLKQAIQQEHVQAGWQWWAGNSGNHTFPYSLFFLSNSSQYRALRKISPYGLFIALPLINKCLIWLGNVTWTKSSTWWCPDQAECLPADLISKSNQSWTGIFFSRSHQVIGKQPSLYLPGVAGNKFPTENTLPTQSITECPLVLLN